jgi:hypothetical protein
MTAPDHSSRTVSEAEHTPRVSQQTMPLDHQARPRYRPDHQGSCPPPVKVHVESVISPVGWNAHQSSLERASLLGPCRFPRHRCCLGSRGSNMRGQIYTNEKAKPKYRSMMQGEHYQTQTNPRHNDWCWLAPKINLPVLLSPHPITIQDGSTPPSQPIMSPVPPAASMT